MHKWLSYLANLRNCCAQCFDSNIKLVHDLNQKYDAVPQISYEFWGFHVLWRTYWNLQQCWSYQSWMTYLCKKMLIIALRRSVSTSNCRCNNPLKLNIIYTCRVVRCQTTLQQPINYKIINYTTNPADERRRSIRETMCPRVDFLQDCLWSAWSRCRWCEILSNFHWIILATRSLRDPILVSYTSHRTQRDLQKRIV